MTASPSPEAGRVIAAFRALRQELDAIPAIEDRSIMRDALRDALDRDAAHLRPGDGETGAVIAASWIVAGRLHEGSHTRIDHLRHRDLGSDHALKRLHPEHAHDPLFRTMLLKEYVHQHQVRHRNVLSVETLIRLDDGSPAIVMPLVSGSSLTLMLRNGALTPEALPALFAGICNGLAAIHEAGLVHGDLTPANILLQDSQPAAVLICDFGLSEQAGACPEGFDELGTPGFIAPERDGACPCDPAQDLFSLGVLLRCCLQSSPAGAMSNQLAELAQALCEPDPRRRPSLDRIIRDHVFDEPAAGSLLRLSSNRLRQTGPVMELATRLSPLRLDRAAPVAKLR